jgi:hypothetical protein
MVLSERAVLRAFRSSGVALWNPQAGFMQSVTTLTLQNPVSSYTLGVSIYPTTVDARQAFRGGVAAWREAGDAVALVRNVIVAVVPRGAVIGHKARRPFAMPARISESLAHLQR